MPLQREAQKDEMILCQKKAKLIGKTEPAGNSKGDAFVRIVSTFNRVIDDRVRRELQNWKLKRVNAGAIAFDREAPEFFLSSGTAILKHTLAEAWKRFIRPANIKNVIFFLDDLHNLAQPSPEAIALVLRDQFQEFAIQNINYSLCFSARTDYFANIRNFAEPAVRFYDQVYLAPFTVEETREYAAAVFGDERYTHDLAN